MFEKRQIRLAIMALVACFLALVGRTQAQTAWTPDLMPREREMVLALSAGPPHFAQEAGAYALEKSGYVKVRESKNGFHCFVGRSAPGSLEPECYDAEGSETRMPVELFEGELRMQGKSRQEIEQAVAEGYANGRFRAARRPGIVYMLSKENRLPIDEEGKTVIPYRPHVMFYAPYLTNADIGAKPGPGATAFVIGEGTPGALIIVPVPMEEGSAGTKAPEGGGGLDAGSRRESGSLGDSGLKARATKARPIEPGSSTKPESSIEPGSSTENESAAGAADESGSAQEMSASGGRLIRLTNKISDSQSNPKESETMAGKVKPIPDGYHSVTPYLVVRGAAKAIDYYRRAFGAKERVRMDGPGGKIAHAELDLGDSVIMLGDEDPGQGASSPQTIGGTAVHIFLYVEDVDATFQQAVKAGAKAVMPPTDMFWGDRYGKLTDPFGHSWGLATHTEDVSPEEMQKRMAQMYAQAPK